MLMRTYTNSHKNTRTHIHVFMHIHRYPRLYTPAYVNTYIHTCAPTYADAHTYVYTHTCRRTHKRAYTCIRKHVHAYTPILIHAYICKDTHTQALEYTDCISVKGYDSLDGCPGYDTKQSNGVAPVMLGLWGIRITPSLPWLPDPLLHGGVARMRSCLWVK